MREVLTMSTGGMGGKGKKRGGGRTRWKQNNFREADVGYNWDDFNMYIKTWLSDKGKQASRETERGRRRAKWGARAQQDI